VKHKVKNIHFVGIGGSGMSGIAEVLANLGFVVSGSDLADNATTRHLAALGVRTTVGHAAENVSAPMRWWCPLRSGRTIPKSSQPARVRSPWCRGRRCWPN
jgi:UDP-N-acetylmuramate-alanine ligase